MGVFDVFLLCYIFCVIAVVLKMIFEIIGFDLSFKGKHLYTICTKKMNKKLSAYVDIDD